MSAHLDPTSFFYGLDCGVFLGCSLVWWWRGTCNALRSTFPRPRRGSNPPPPGRKPAPPPPPPAPGMRREYFSSPSQMAECGGPCWEAQDPSCCDCGGLWRDVPSKSVTFTEGRVQRSNGNSGPTIPKPLIKPMPQGRRMGPEP